MQTMSDIVTLQNIDNEDFYFTYDKHPYVVKAGQIRRFPRFLAAHCLKHLIDKILTKQEKRTNNEEARAAVASKVVIEEETFNDEPVKTESEILDERIDDLNRPSDLENILKKNKTAPTGDSTIVPEKTEPTEAPEEEREEAPKEEEKPKEVPLKPSRSELMDYARDTLKMDLTNKKTMASLEKMTVDQLIKGLDYPYPPEEA